MGVCFTVSLMIRCASSSVGGMSSGEESGFRFVLVMGGVFGGAVSVRGCRFDSSDSVSSESVLSQSVSSKSVSSETSSVVKENDEVVEFSFSSLWVVRDLLKLLEACDFGLCFV